MLNTGNLDNDKNLDQAIKEFGVRIFKEIGKSQSSSFSKQYWTGKIMEWSMLKPEIKINMFRLVDVLPALKSSRAVAAHVNEYLGKVGASIHGLAEWGLNVKPTSIRAKLTSAIVKKSVQQTASQFIAGENPKKSLKALRRIRKAGMAFTVDLLGEYSVSEKEALVYLERYLEALDTLGNNVPSWPEAAPIREKHPCDHNPVCVSVKLSALYSQCDVLNFNRSVEIMSERLATIANKAKEVNALLYVDAEDTAHNPIIYETFKRVFISDALKDFPYPGIVLQAYLKESESLLDDLIAYAKKRGAPIAIRLVKGAYWDSETILAHQNQWPAPVYSIKSNSDANYEKLSKVLLQNTEHVLPAFGSHNVRSLSHACCYAEANGIDLDKFEIQVLFGMADPIAKAFAAEDYLVRQYVPLGELIPGMGYLVRRLLENTSNESFLRHTFYDEDDVDGLLTPPVFGEQD